MIDTPDRPDQPYADTTRAADCGEFLAAVVVHPDGTESLWLFRETDDGEHGCACAECVPHEQLTPARYPNRKG